MKKPLLILGLLLCAIPARATIALVQHPAGGKDCATAASCALAYGSNPATNNLLIAVARLSGGTGNTSITVSDTLNGATWTTLTRVDNGTLVSLVGFFIVNGSTGADTVTISVSPNEPIRMAIYEYSGTATVSPLDTQNTGTGTTGTTFSSTSITPAAGNELVISWVGPNQSQTLTAGTNFLLEDAVPASPNSKLGYEDWIQTSATATTGPMTGNTSDNGWTAHVAAFKPAAGGATAPPALPIIGVGSASKKKIRRFANAR